MIDTLRKIDNLGDYVMLSIWAIVFVFAMVRFRGLHHPAIAPIRRLFVVMVLTMASIPVFHILDVKSVAGQIAITVFQVAAIGWCFLSVRKLERVPAA
jgi:hypothetical protein